METGDHHDDKMDEQPPTLDGSVSNLIASAIQTTLPPVEQLSASVHESHFDEFYLLKPISYYDGSRTKTIRILTQNHNGPCPLIALCAVSLSSTVVQSGSHERDRSFSEQEPAVSQNGGNPYPGGDRTRRRKSSTSNTDSVSFDNVLAILADHLLSKQGPSTRTEDYQHTLADVLLLLPTLSTGLDLNLHFTSSSSFEFTPSLSLFDVCSVGVFHGWVCGASESGFGVVGVGGLKGYNGVVEAVVAGDCARLEMDVREEGRVAERFALGSPTSTPIVVTPVQVDQPVVHLPVSKDHSLVNVVEAPMAATGGIVNVGLEDAVTRLVEDSLRDDDAVRDPSALASPEQLIHLSHDTGGVTEPPAIVVDHAVEQLPPMAQLSTLVVTDLKEDGNTPIASTTATPELFTPAVNTPYDHAEEEAKEKKRAAEQERNDTVISIGTACVDFLQHTASQLTNTGLKQLVEDTPVEKPVVFFRNNHFATLVNHNGKLYTLVTDQAYVKHAIVWETLDSLDGNSTFVDAQFKPVAGISEEWEVVPGLEIAMTDVDAVESDFAMASRLDEEDGDFAMAVRLQEEEERLYPAARRQIRRVPPLVSDARPSSSGQSSFTSSSSVQDKKDTCVVQ